MKNGLVVTNYNNFKDLSYFIGQHKQALRMIEEVDNFYLSFLKSKLIHSYEISRWPGNLISCKEVDTVNLYLSKYFGNKAYVKRINEIIKQKAEELNFFETANYEKEKEVCIKIVNAIEEEFVGKDIQFTLPDCGGFPSFPRVRGTIIRISSGTSDIIDIIDTYEVALSSLNFVVKLKKPVKEYFLNMESYSSWIGGPRSSDFYDVVKSFEDKENTKDFNYRIEKAYKKIYEMPDGQQLLKDQLEKLYKKNNVDFWFAEKDHKVIPFSQNKDLEHFKFTIGEHPLISIRAKYKSLGIRGSQTNVVEAGKEYLIVSKTTKSAGNTTDRWMTFYEETEHLEALLFDISSGNLSDYVSTTYVTYKRRLNVQNGWHPYDDD